MATHRGSLEPTRGLSARDPPCRGPTPRRTPHLGRRRSTLQVRSTTSCAAALRQDASASPPAGGRVLPGLAANQDLAEALGSLLGRNGLIVCSLAVRIGPVGRTGRVARADGLPNCRPSTRVAGGVVDTLTVRIHRGMLVISTLSARRDRGRWSTIGRALLGAHTPAWHVRTARDNEPVHALPAHRRRASSRPRCRDVRDGQGL